VIDRGQVQEQHCVHFTQIDAVLVRAKLLKILKHVKNSLLRTFEVILLIIKPHKS